MSYYLQYLQINADTSDPDHASAQNNLALAYKQLASIAFDKKDWDASLDYIKKAMILRPDDYELNYNAGSASYNKMDYPSALAYYKAAYKYAKGSTQISEAKKRVEETENKIASEEMKKNAPSNDPLSYLQYYLKDLNIPKAWTKVQKPKEVVVALIDDGININHPDLGKSIWSDLNAKYGSSKIIDFVGDGMPSNLPVGEHGTMIAGII